MINANSRAGLSLLGYCYYMNQDFLNAVSCYEQLSQLYPDLIHYKLNHAQCLYQLCNYDEALHALSNLPEFESSSTSGGSTVEKSISGEMINRNDLLKIQAAIKYGQDELLAARALIDQLPSEDSDKEVNAGCLLYKEEHYEESLEKFNNALSLEGYKPDLSYNIALTHYQLKQYPSALKHIGDIIERGRYSWLKFFRTLFPKLIITFHWIAILNYDLFLPSLTRDQRTSRAQCWLDNGRNRSSKCGKHNHFARYCSGGSIQFESGHRISE